MTSERIRALGRESPAGLLTGLSDKLQELDQAVSRQAERLHAVLEIGAAISGAKDVDALLKAVIERLTGLLGAEAATLFMLDAERGELWSRVLRGSALKEIRVSASAGIAGHVVQTGEPLLLGDAYQDVRFNPEIDRQSGFRTRSLIAAPLRHVSGRVLGVVEVLERRANAFSQEDLALVCAVGGQIAAVLDNVLLLEQLRRRNQELLAAQADLSQAVRDLDALFEVERAVSSAEQESELLDRILAKACAVTGATAASVLLTRDEVGTLHFRSAHGEHAEALLSLTLRPGQGIAGHVAARGEAVRVEDAAQSPLHDKSIGRKLGVAARAVLCVPIRGDDTVLGALELLNKPSGFDEGDEKFATLLAGQTGRAILLRRERDEGERRRRLEDIGRMLSGVVHDLRTPMTVIKGYAELMEEEEDAAERHAHAAVIAQQFDHLQTMMGETLAFARGERALLLSGVQLHRFLADVEQHLRPDLERTGVELRVVAGYKGPARLDEGKLKRLVHNIARNAQEAMPGGGRFTLAAERDGGELVLRFSDTGPGIPEDIADRLFESFVSSGKAGGTGLGLALVKRVAEEHGGSVTYRSRPGKGTTFEVRLPLGLEPGEG